MSFGLSNCPLTCMRLMNTVLHGLIGNTTSVSLDDILIVSKTEEERFSKLDRVFSRSRVAGLKVELEKCSILEDIDKHGLRTVASKVEAVRNFPVPNKV